jgi:hypothetical protein
MECLIKNNIMDALLQDTIKATTVTKEWIVVDADGHNLGRLHQRSQ